METKSERACTIERMPATTAATQKMAENAGLKKKRSLFSSRVSVLSGLKAWSLIDSRFLKLPFEPRATPSSRVQQ